MKATLSFNLDEERELFDNAVNGSKLEAAIQRFDTEVLRQYVKYDNSLSEKENELVQKIRTKLWEIYNEEME